MKNIIIYTVIIGIISLFLIDLGLDIYIKYQKIMTNSGVISTENIANFEIIDDI